MIFLLEIIPGVPLLLVPPAGPADQPQSERIEGPAQNTYRNPHSTLRGRLI
jgi:hypothetical protein